MENVVVIVIVCVFFFKQKTAYEMRISDWSSDVCSSDLGLADVGAYYRDYVRLMAHIDAVQPGRVHRVIHEALLDDPEAEVRAMLAYLDQPFEEACLRSEEHTSELQ